MAGAVIAICVAQSAWGQGLNYVEADDLIPNIAPTSAINASSAVADDNLWGYRTGFGANGSIFQADDAEDVPELTQTITGLAPNTSYDLYAVYWTDKDENWSIRTGTSAGNLTTYSWTGGKGQYPIPDSTKGVTAGAAIWDTLPIPTIEGTVFTQRPADPLVMLLAKAGTANSNGAGEAQVVVDDIAAAGGARRSWFDGVAYVAAGTPIALNATIDRSTGELTISNPTDRSFQITSITLDSPAGALNEAGWTPISGRLDGGPGGNSSFDNDPWDVIPSTADPPVLPAVQLVEQENASGFGTGGTLAANGGSLSLGSVWTPSAIEDVRLSLVLSGGELAMISPTFLGDPILAGDFNGSGGGPGLDDFEILLNNMHTDVSSLTAVQRQTLGDMNNDGTINFFDYHAFRTAYDAGAGAGAFDRLVGQVPEPGTLGMVCLGLLGAAAIRRRRTAVVAMVMLVGLVLSAPASAQLLKIDVNSRAGEPATPAPPGPNTVEGFFPFTLNEGTTGAQSDASSVVNGYTISVTGVDAAGNPLAALDDRDRATPTGTPTLNQLYDDFFFVNAATVGEGGGLDLSISSGGALEPNRHYSFSVYSYDTSSTGLRTANWLDANRNNAVMFGTSFDGATAAVADDQFKFTGIARTDDSGNLLVRGRSISAAGTHGVFLNGFEIAEFVGPTLEVNTVTGEVRLLNDQATPIDLSYYEIRSASGALDAAAWQSLSDSEGNDPLGTGWDEVPNSNENLLSELRLESQTTLSQEDAPFSLGNAFMIGGAEDLTFAYAGPDNANLLPGIVTYVDTPGGLAGDFNGNGTVENADLTLLLNNWGAAVPPVPAGWVGDQPQGDAIDNSELTALLNNWGNSLGSGALASSTAVPEPTAMVLLLAAGALVGLARRSR